MTNPAGLGVSHTYVLCTKGKEGQEVPSYVQRAQADPSWRFVELAAGHGAHVTAPQTLADLLVGLVQPS